MKKGRKPRQDEVELWGKVTKQVTPIEVRPTPSMQELLENAPPPKPMPDPSQPFQINGSGASPRDNLAPTLSQHLSDQHVQMDRKAFTKMRRGKLRPDAKIDLHGMTLDRAHVALTRFVLSSHKSGKRLLLVVTGKGKHRDDGGPIPVRLGVLRHQVPQWLRIPPLVGIVLQVTQAHQSHGGGGAYYVYLRRTR